MVENMTLEERAIIVSLIVSKFHKVKDKSYFNKISKGEIFCDILPYVHLIDDMSDDEYMEKVYQLFINTIGTKD